jgi:hypothetical protein
MAALFHERVQHFMQQHILAKDNPILGRVNHHTVRYESQVRGWPVPPCHRQTCTTVGTAASLHSMLLPPPPPASPQHRGSLHAHILLWVDPADAAKVAQEITATRCNYAPDNDTPGPAGCPWHDDVHLSGTNDLQQMTTEERLHRLVQRKQIHTCRAGPLGCCRGDRPCRYGFLFPSNLDAKSGRCAAPHPCLTCRSGAVHVPLCQPTPSLAATPPLQVPVLALLRTGPSGRPPGMGRPHDHTVLH